MSDNTPKLTPMYRQYLEIKKEYPDSLLFYRMGDFYELFFEDAEVASRELQLALTSRSRDEGGIPMCGGPGHRRDQRHLLQWVGRGRPEQPGGHRPPAGRPGAPGGKG